jgi:hypothetical protein
VVHFYSATTEIYQRLTGTLLLRRSHPVEEYYRSTLGNPKKTHNDRWIFLCPFHDDQTTPNLAVYFGGGFNCFCCGAKGGDVLAFNKIMTGNTFSEVLKELAGKYFPELLKENVAPIKKKQLIATYSYKDENGDLLYQVLRYEPKDFSQRQPDGNGGWKWNLKEICKVPYRLQELLSSSGPVYIVGGEKDCETLAKHGVTATTNACGEGKWDKEYNQHLKNRSIVIIEDNDAPGRKHGRLIAESLYGVATDIKIIRFPELDEKGDTTDYLEKHSFPDLEKKVSTAPTFLGSYEEYFGETKPNIDSDYDDTDDECENERKNQTQLLIELTSDWERLHTPDGEHFITFSKDGHEETYLIKSKEIRNLLTGLFFRHYGKPSQPQALSNALSLLEAQAQFEGKEYQVFNRIADLNDNLYLDLCNNNWEVVEITSSGWNIISNPPVKFVRTRSMNPIPRPLEGGSVDELRVFTNVTENELKLIVGFLLACLRTKGPFPVLSIQGEQGSGKSFFCRLVKSLVDPCKALLKTLPSNERDLVISAKNSWVLAFDNLSGLKHWMSDSLCRLSTGGGFSIRELYTDADEIIFDSQRAQILNGIDDIAVRADLRDRALIISLPVISREQRKDEESILVNFDKVRSSILGGLLDAVSVALKNKDSVKLENPPRMADFAKWVTAAEPGLGWEPGSFMAAYNENRSAAIGIGLESDVLAQAMIDFQKDVVEWDGTATELLDALGEQVSEKISKLKHWPKAANTFSNRLRRLAPVLREVGIEVEFETREGKRRNRLISIRKCSEKTVPIGHTVRQDDTSHKNKELFADDDVTNSEINSAIADDPIERPVCDDLLITKEETEADDANDDSSTLPNSQIEWEEI